LEHLKSLKTGDPGKYAEISVPDMWKKLGGLRNPVNYIDDLEKYVDMDRLEWKRVNPQTDGEPPRAASPISDDRGMDITEAKKALSVFYRVPVSNIEILIRG
jgi:hypothetical protein